MPHHQYLFLCQANDVHAAQCDYEALNAQLLDELPLLCQFAQQLFKDCICCYNRSQGNFYDNIVKKMYTLLTVSTTALPVIYIVLNPLSLCFIFNILSVDKFIFWISWVL